jgi:hypothetical protein
MSTRAHFAPSAKIDGQHRQGGLAANNETTQRMPLNIRQAQEIKRLNLLSHHYQKN